MGADLYTCQQLHRESSSQGGAEKQEGGCLYKLRQKWTLYITEILIYEGQIYVAICFSTYFDAYLTSAKAMHSRGGGVPGF